jgi:DNA-binding response OmpR family regulator
MMDRERETNIMAVDDEPANLKLLEDMLGKEGYRVRSFPRGRMALRAAIQNPPDLILLDVNMPEMNGYDVCKRLGADARLKDIPVIFLSALNDTEDKLKAFQCGAVDYITKPFQFEEVRARVETHSRLHRLQQTLARHNQRLEDTVRQRTLELAEALGRLKILDQAKRDFLNLISHELRTPLNGLLGVGDLLLAETGPHDELRDMFEQSGRRILSIVDDALVLSQIDVEQEKFVCERLPLAGVLSRAITRADEFARSRNVNLERAPATSIFILGVDELLVKALQSLLETAVRFSAAGGWVRLQYRLAPHAVQVILEVCGRTVPAAVIPRFFEVLSVGEAVTADGDFGLGPAVAHRILALFGASVSLENRDPAGIRLTLGLQHAESGMICEEPVTSDLIA